MRRIPLAAARLLVCTALPSLGLGLPLVGSAQVPDSIAIAQLARTPDAPLPFDPRARMRQLPNGIRYYIRANAKPARRAELRLVVNVGSIVEDDDQLGLAHVLEHMAFNGTRRFAKQQIVDFIERAGMKFGADLNAGTSFDETVYQLQVPTDTGNYLARALDWLADIAGGGITLDSVELAKERPVVIEEWRLGRGAQERLQQQQFPLLFQNSRYRSRLPIGTKESLDRFTRDAVARFYRDWYRPDLIAVVAVGDFDPDAIEAMIRERFGSIPPPPPNARSRNVASVPGHTETLVSVASDAEATESNLGIVWKQQPTLRRTIADYRRDLAGALFLAMINERFREIVQRPNAPLSDAGAGQGRLVRAMESFSLSAIVPAGGIERGLVALVEEAERARRFGFTTGELVREKAGIQRGIDIQFSERDKTESDVFAARYVDHFLTGDPLIGIEVRAPLIRAMLPAITLEEVNAVVRASITDSNRVVIASAPVRAGVTLPSEQALRAVLQRARTMSVTAYADPAGGHVLVPTPPAPGRIVAERKLDALDATEWTLSNGVRVIVKQTDFQADQILIEGMSLGGVSGLTPERYFSARLASTLLERGGAGSIDAITLGRMLTGKNAAVSAELGDREESVSGRTSPKDVETFFEVLWARTQTPRMDTAAVTALKQQISSSIRDRSNHPMAPYFDTIGTTMSRGHPLAKALSDSIVQTLDVRIALEEFRDRFRDFSDFTFVIVGAITPEAVRPLVEKWLASLPGGGRQETPRDAGIRMPTGRINKVVRRGMEPRAQTTILISGETPWSRDVATRAAVISEILTMRLRETLRENLGGTYGVSIGASVDRWPVERFVTSVSFGAAPERVDSLAEVALSELRRFATNGPTADELAKVKEGMLRSRETDAKENQYWVELLLSPARWGADARDEHQTFQSRVRALDAESIKALARVLFNETNLARFTLLPEKK